MTIRVQCEHCQSKFQTEASHAGKSTRCPSCHRPLVIPSPNQAPTRSAKVQKELPKGPPAAQAASGHKNSKPSQNDVAKRLLDGFSGPIQRTRPTLRYRLSTLIVALVMVLLPLVYVALIGLVGYGVYYHAVNHTGMVGMTISFRGRLFLLLAYAAPMFCGVVLILFMLKPLLIRRSEEGRTRSLNRNREPLLFAFIDRICEVVGAPRPTRIDLDCQLNASASYGHGIASLFGSDLILTIGLPLVAGLNTRQFAGVLAHEFGHFAQGAGMRLTYLIRSISHWLLRVVYERDAADEWLAQSAETLDMRIAWIAYLAMMFVWLSRRILWVLMMLGHFVGSYLLRQMEFDADRYETRLAGSQTFMQTAVGLQILGLATQRVYADLNQNLREEHLVDDLPKVIVLTAEQLPEAIQEAILSSIETTPTGWFDTHPSDCDRIASSQREDTEGVFRVELPASALFNDFEAQSKATTWEFYREQLGDSIQRNQLVAVESVLAKQEEDHVSQSSLNRFFQGNWIVTLPFALRYKHSQPSENPQQTLNELKATREQMLREMAITGPAFESLRQSQSQLALAEKLRHCCRAGLEVEIDGLTNPKNGEQEANRIASEAKKKIVAATRAVDAYQDVATRRLGAALQLLHEPKVAKRIPHSDEALRRCQELLPCYTVISDQMPTLVQIMHLHGALGLLVERLPEDGNESVYLAIQGITRHVEPAIRLLRNSWQRNDYPYGQPGKQLSLTTFLIPELPIRNQASTIFNCCDQAVSGTLPLYLRLLGDLTRIAEAVEKAVGLEALPMVASGEKKSPSQKMGKPAGE